jgi:hypothetical protein
MTSPVDMSLDPEGEIDQPGPVIYSAVSFKTICWLWHLWADKHLNPSCIHLKTLVERLSTLSDLWAPRFN